MITSEDLKNVSPGARKIIQAYMDAPPEVQAHADKYFEMILNGTDGKKAFDMMRDDWHKMHSKRTA